MAKKDNKEEKKEPVDELKVLFPGRKMPLGDTGLVVTVVPLGFRHLRRFTRTISGAVMHMMSLKIKVDEKADEKQIAEAKKAAIMAQLIPYILENAFELFAECVVMPNGVALDDVPHWEIAPLLEAWITESFGEERKWLPWKEAVERIVTQVTGKKFSFSETASNS